MKNRYKIGDKVKFRGHGSVLEVREITQFGTVIVTPIEDPLEVAEYEWHDLKPAKYLNALQKIKKRMKL